LKNDINDIEINRELLLKDNKMIYDELEQINVKYNILSNNYKEDKFI
jgi:hypothetical protein